MEDAELLEFLLDTHTLDNQDFVEGGLVTSSNLKWVSYRETKNQIPLQANVEIDSGQVSETKQFKINAGGEQDLELELSDLILNDHADEDRNKSSSASTETLTKHQLRRKSKAAKRRAKNIEKTSLEIVINNKSQKENSFEHIDRSIDIQVSSAKKSANQSNLPMKHADRKIKTTVTKPTVTKPSQANPVHVSDEGSQTTEFNKNVKRKKNIKNLALDDYIKKAIDVRSADNNPIPNVETIQGKSELPDNTIYPPNNINKVTTNDKKVTEEDSKNPTILDSGRKKMKSSKKKKPNLKKKNILLTQKPTLDDDDKQQISSQDQSIDSKVDPSAMRKKERNRRRKERRKAHNKQTKKETMATL